MPLVNVTVTEKETAILPCSVRFLGSHQVVWTDQSSTLLTFEDRRIIDDERLSVERPFTKDWNLHIRKVLHKDQGVYQCQVNTIPISIKTVNLIVEVPSKIIEHLSSEDLVVRENEEVTLVCNVTGVPAPEVTWFRHVQGRTGVEKHSEFCAGTDQVGVNGEVLIIHNVTRHCGDTYECVASNGVPPPVSHFVQVDVEFGPEINLPNKRIGQDVGRETILECTVTAFPHAVTMWERNGEKVSTLSQKYRLEIYDEDHNTITLSLRIFSIEPHDYGTYTCVASNPLGQDSESMVLYEYSAHIRTILPTTMLIPTTTATRKRSTTQMILLRPGHVVDRVSGKASRGQLSPSGTLYPPLSFPDHWRPHKSQQGGPRGKEAPPSAAENKNSAYALHLSTCTQMMMIVCFAILRCVAL